MKKLSGDKKTLVMECAGGRRRKVECPVEWKLTFGSIASKPNLEARYDGARGWCLRLYEGTMQKAVWTDVISFREESLRVQEMVTRTETKRVKRETPTGVRDGIAEMKVSEWRDADDVDPTNDQRYLEADVAHTKGPF